jgi:hypothetical protein
VRTEYEVAQVLDQAWDKLAGLNGWQIRTLRALRACRTAALGGHIDECDRCSHVKVSYNSCRNRHCPKCQGHKREEWIQQRSQELLPVPYFHVVFTLPEELNGLSLHQPKMIYDSLFDAAWATVSRYGGEGMVSGMISILHTWGQNLSLHPHIHCIVPAVVVDRQGNSKAVKSRGRFLYTVKGMSKVFKAKYMALLRQRVAKEDIPKSLFDKSWVVYAKRPFGGVESVIEYLGRYTHKIAISNSRIKGIDDKTVSFTYKDYKEGGEQKLMQLSHEEFVRRFAMHILPKRFVRIRHYGFLSSTWKRCKLKELQIKLYDQIGQKPPIEEVKTMLHCCPICKHGTMIRIMTFGRRGPPTEYTKADYENRTPQML